MWVTLSKTWNGKPVGEQISVSDTDGDVLTKAGYATRVEGDPMQGVMADTFQKGMANLTDSLSKAVNASLQQYGEASNKSRRNANPLIFGNDHHADPELGFGKWLQAVKVSDTKAIEKFWPDSLKDLGTTTGAAGGFLMPTDFADTLMSVPADNVVVRPRAYIQPMRSKVCEVPVIDASTAPTAGNTAAYGGLKMTWADDNTDRTENDPAFKQIRLEAHDLGGYLEASNSLIEDSAEPLEALLKRLFRGAVDWYEDYAFLRGSGAGQPLGIVNAAALISVTRSGASAFSLADAANMYARLLPGANPSSVCWAVHPYQMGRLIAMVSSSTGGQLAWMPEGVRMSPRLMLLGFPVIPTEKLPAPNTAGDVLLADCGQYIIGDRKQIEIAYSPHAAFKKNQGAWRIVCRVDGQPWMRAAMTLSDTTSTVSPFVTLAAG